MTRLFVFCNVFLFSNFNKILADETKVNATNCKGLLGSDIVKFITDLFNMVKWIALALGLVLGMLDFFKAITGGKDGALKEAGQRFVKRLIGIVFLFILPIILDYVLDISGVSNGGTCLNS